MSSSVTTPVTACVRCIVRVIFWSTRIIGKRNFCKNTNNPETRSARNSALCVANDFGNTSPNTISAKVTNHVAIVTAIAGSNFTIDAIVRESCVANAAVTVVSKLNNIATVISSVSILLFICCKLRAPGLFCLSKALTLCWGRESMAISLPATKADEPKRKINKRTDSGFIERNEKNNKNCFKYSIWLPLYK